MSNIALVSPASGTATFSITTPSGTSTDRTLTLPDAAGTIQVSGNPISGTTGTFTGLVDISAAGAGQIQFPATQNASANANTLDDYEEGTWTPAWSFSTSGSVTLSITGATYTKVGRLVTIQCRIFTTALSSPTGNATLTGLPFTNGGSDTSASIGLALRFNTDLPNLKGFVTGSAATISLQTQATNGASETPLTGANFGTAGGNQNIIAISATYFV